jgi:hypothetical protein
MVLMLPVSALSDAACITAFSQTDRIIFTIKPMKNMKEVIKYTDRINGIYMIKEIF